jgi:hypothetical protein
MVCKNGAVEWIVAEQHIDVPPLLPGMDTRRDRLVGKHKENRCQDTNGDPAGAGAVFRLRQGAGNYLLGA